MVNRFFLKILGESRQKMYLQRRSELEKYALSKLNGDPGILAGILLKNPSLFPVQNNQDSNQGPKVR
jgi:hypothetical protein